MSDKIEEVALDPKWTWGRLVLHNIAYVTLHHPRLGPVTVMVSEETLRSLAEGLTKLSADSTPAPGAPLQ